MTSEETREPRPAVEFLASIGQHPYVQELEECLRVVLKERDEAEEICANSGQVVTDLEDRLLRAEEALRKMFDAAVDRWHETCPNDERPLHEWLDLTWDEYAKVVQLGISALGGPA
jgi:hypothetical protein